MHPASVETNKKSTLLRFGGFQSVKHQALPEGLRPAYPSTLQCFSNARVRKSGDASFKNHFGWSLSANNSGRKNSAHVTAVAQVYKYMLS